MYIIPLTCQHKSAHRDPLVQLTTSGLQTQALEGPGRRQGSRVAFQTHPRSQASSRGEAKDSTLFSSRDRYLLEPTEWSLLCRRALVYISLYISEHRHSVCMLLHTQNRATRSLMLSMRRGSCAATQQLKNPTNCSFLTSDRARIAVALGSLKTLDPNPSQSRPGF